MNKCLAVAISLLLVNACANTDAPELTLRDITALPGKASSQFPVFIKGEGVAEVFDDSLQSKYLSEHKQDWIQFERAEPELIKAYSLTSAGDAPARDPVNWSLLGSHDGLNWQLLHQVTQFHFDQRHQTQRYELDNQQRYRFFRLSMEQDGVTPWGDEYLQLADVGLYAVTNLPLADFTLSQHTVAPGQWLTLTITCANRPDKFSWHTPGANQQGTGQRIKIRYEQPGVYEIGLQCENTYGHDKINKAFAVKVLDPLHPWQGFKPPEVIVKFEDNQSDGALRLMRVMPELVDDINQVTRQLVQRLYKNFSQVPDFEQVEFQLKWMDTLAYRAGNDKNMVIAFSSKYITEKLKDQDDQQLRYELLGVLWHELVHGYQLMPKARSYGDDPQVHAFIEGMADLVRIQAGYHKTRQPKQSESWLGGYTNTGFFLDFLAKRYEPDLAYKFNKTALTVDDWQFEKALENVIGKPVPVLWQEYQQSLN